MKIPLKLRNADGTNDLEWVVLRGSNSENLKEYGHVTDGENSSCYALTSPGDRITVQYQLSEGLADYLDVQVDGITRESMSSKPYQRFKGIVKRVWHQERRPNNRGLGVLKSGVMVVQERDSKNDKVWDGTDAPSNVGSIILLFIRQKEEQKPDAGDTPMGPMFDTHASWSEVNAQINPADIPPFEIGFTDKKPPSSKSIRTRVTAKRVGQTEIVGSLQFYLRPTSYLVAKGFTDVPTYHASSPSLPGSPNVAKGTSKNGTPQIGTTKIENSRGQPSAASQNMEKAKTAENEENLFVEEDPLGISNGGSKKPQSEVFGPQQTNEGHFKMMSEKRINAEQLKAKALAMASPNVDTLPKIEGDAEVDQPNSAAPIDDHLEDLLIATQEKELDDSAEQLIQQTIDDLIELERASELGRAKQSTVMLELTDTDTFADLENCKKGKVLHGMKEAPAKQAWVERGPTEEADPEESRTSTPVVDEQSQPSRENATQSSIAGHNFRDRDIDELRQFSQIPPHQSPQDRSEERITTRYISVEPQTLMTPPKTSSKSHSFMHVAVGSEAVSQDPSKNDNGIFDTTQNRDDRNSSIQRIEKSAPVSSDTLISESQGDKIPSAIALSTDISEQSKMNNPDSRWNTQNATPPKFTPLALKEEPSIAASEALTETSTEVAPEADIEATRQKSSQVTSNLSYNTRDLIKTPTYLNAPPRLPNPTPEHVSELVRMQRHDRSNETPGNPAAQARLHWQNCSPANEDLVVQRQLQQSPFVNRPLFPNSLIPSSPTPASRIIDPHNLMKFSAEKRKAENFDDYLDGQSTRKRVMSMSPSVNSPNPNHQLQAAQARLAAAEQHNQQLKEEFENALIARQERSKAKELNQQAEQLQRENDEWKAKIAALYTDDF